MRWPTREACLLAAAAGCAGPDQEELDRRPQDRPAALADMVRIPGGPFQRGVDDRRGPDEGPARTIHLSPFLIDRCEVTRERFAEFAAATGRVTAAAADSPAAGVSAEPGHPAVYVTWEEARAYCAWRGARLPTEAEWEKAARGTDGRQWPWGHRPDPSLANGWGPGDFWPGTSPAGAFPDGASPYGVLDMAGNVWEWCADWYDPDYYLVAPRRDPPGPDRGRLRVARGGSWTNPITVLRTSNRHAVHPADAGPGLGFRCAASE